MWDKDKGKLPTLLAKALLNRVLIEKRRKRHTVSLSEVVSRNEDGKVIVLEEIIKDKIDIEKIFEDKEELKFLMECEACRLRAIGYNQEEIGNKLGLSQLYVSRVLRIRKTQLQKKNSAKHYSKSSIKI